MGNIESTFERIGARAKVADAPARPRRWLVDEPGLTIDIASDRRGEYFDLVVPEDVELVPLNVRPKERHLLLFVRGADEDDRRFLCGHDERHWFAAAVPERVSTVRDAIDALKPEAVRAHDKRLRKKLRTRRRNPAYLRQGEWFFIPAPELEVDEMAIGCQEPLTRGRGKPHIAEQAVRWGGELVWVSADGSERLTESGYRRLLRRDPSALGQSWRAMRRDPDVYVRGRVTHPDHATIVLDGWHRVEMNTESRAGAVPSLAFLD